MNTDWKTLSDIMDKNQTVKIVDTKGYTCQGQITSADHRSMFIDVSGGDHKAVWLAHVLKFEIVDE